MNEKDMMTKLKLRYLLSLLLLAVTSVGFAQSTWVKTELADLQTGDIVVIVDETSGKAMTNTVSSSAPPSAVAFDVTNVGTNIQWEVKVKDDTCQFYVPEKTDYLYCTSSNNGVRVGSTGNTNKNFIIKKADANNNNDYLYNTGTSRYLGVYNSTDWRCYTTVNSNIKDCLTVFYKLQGKKDPSVTIGKTSINIDEDTEVSINGGLSLTVTTSNPSIASVEGTTVTGVAAGTATITASWDGNDTYNGGTKEFTVTVLDPNGPGTSAQNPYTVAQARTAIANNAGVTGVYATGIVSEIVTPFNSQYGNISYNISADGTTTADQLQAYRGKGINGANFTSADDIQVGDEVVIFGNLKKHNDIYEFDADNQLVSLKRKTSAGLAYATTTVKKNVGDAAFTNELTNPNNLPVTYSSSKEVVATIDAQGEVTILSAGTTTITASFAGNSTYAIGSASYTLTVVDPNAPGTINNPYTVAQALEVIGGLNNGGYSEDSVYVKGIISKINQIVQNGKARYYISDDGSEANELYIYDGKYLENVVFTDNTQIVVGDSVIIYGKLQKYVNNNVVTPEMAKDNYIVNLKHDNRADAELAYDVESFTATIGEQNEFPELENPNGLTVTYTSSNTSVATIDASGAITLVAAGTTTITASFDGNEGYKAGEASYTLTVVEPTIPGKETKYELVTSTDEITSGKYLIVYVSEEGQAVAFDGSLKTLDAVENTFDVTIENDIITTDQNNYFNIDVVNGTLQSASGYYIGVSGNSNGLKQTTNDETYTHEFSIDDDGYAVIAANFEGSTMTLRYNKASNQSRFRYYSNGQQPIYLYKEVEEVEIITVKISSAGYATLYYSDKSLEVPSGVTAYTVTVDGKNIVLNDNLGSVIPAGFGVVLEADEGNYDFIVTEGPADEDKPEPGALEGTDEEDFISDGTSKYYVLSLAAGSTDARTIGFYYDPTTNPADGSSVNNGAHKAYLKVDASSSASAYPFNTTGIKSIITTADDNEVYTLSGIRVKGQLSKGIYIVNGKKMVIK